MLIKVILLFAILAIAIVLVRSTTKTKYVALRRMLLLVFVVIAVISVLFPAITTRVAQFVGVGRGTDLILYMLVLAFLSYSVVNYRRMNILENRMTDLARELAIAQSNPALKLDQEVVLPREETGPNSQDETPPAPDKEH